MEVKLQPPAVTESVDLPPVAAPAAPKSNPGTLQRTALRTSRLLDFCKLNPGERDRPLFTNHRRLYVAEPAPRSCHRLVRKGETRGGD
jgi:hypothetical protein